VKCSSIKIHVLITVLKQLS